MYIMTTAVIYMRRRDFLMAAAGAVVGAGLFYLSRLATDTRPPAAAPAEEYGTVLEATERGFRIKGDINPVLRFTPRGAGQRRAPKSAEGGDHRALARV
jgi:hypothetical protein